MAAFVFMTYGRTEAASMGEVSYDIELYGRGQKPERSADRSAESTLFIAFNHRIMKIM